MKVLFKRLRPFLIILIIIIMGCFGGWWDVFFMKAAPTRSLKPAVPSIDMSQTKLTGWDKGKKSWEIEARRIWQSADGNMVYFQKIIHGVAFSMNDKRVDFTSDWARWERARELLYLGGGLEAKVDDSIVNTAEAIINYRTEELTSSTRVRVTEKETVATAKTMRIDLAKDELILEGDVVLVQNRDRVTADGVIFYHKDETYELIGPKGAIINP
jgi:LPS export ABC transporter protein LptC